MSALDSSWESDGKSTIVEARNLYKKYGSKNKELQVLCGINLNIRRGNIYIIKGRSGVGKSTLLNLLGALDVPTSGDIFCFGKLFSRMTRREIYLIRRNWISIIFQGFNLIETWTAHENVESSLAFHRFSNKERRERAKSILNQLGLISKLDFLPCELSVGEQQRVAVSRTLVSNPELILADEPTGSVDSETGANIMRVLTEYIRSTKAAMVVCTHGQYLPEWGDYLYRLENGILSIS